MVLVYRGSQVPHLKFQVPPRIVVAADSCLPRKINIHLYVKGGPHFCCLVILRHALIPPLLDGTLSFRFPKRMMQYNSKPMLNSEKFVSHYNDFILFLKYFGVLLDCAQRQN